MAATPDTARLVTSRHSSVRIAASAAVSSRMTAEYSSSVPAGAANQPNLTTPITTLAAHANRMAKQPTVPVIR